jgi:hypothetical protein
MNYLAEHVVALLMTFAAVNQSSRTNLRFNVTEILLKLYIFITESNGRRMWAYGIALRAARAQPG